MALSVATHVFTVSRPPVLALAAAILYDKEISAINSGSSLARRRSTNGTVDCCLDFKSL